LEEHFLNLDFSMEFSYVARAGLRERDLKLRIAPTSEIRMLATLLLTVGN